MKKSKWSARSLDENIWVMVPPSEVNEVGEEFERCRELMEREKYNQAEEALREILEKVPRHIEVINHLAILSERRGANEEGGKLWEKAVSIAEEGLPGDLGDGDKLEWICSSNRPYHRALRGWGIYLVNHEEDLRRGTVILAKSLALNPMDNLGIREILMELYLVQDRFPGALALCERYDDDTLPAILYGHPLVLFKLGRRKEGAEKLKKAVKCLPKVAKELLKKRHPKPKPKMAEYIIRGGWEEAYEYWKAFGDFWGEEELEWLREVVG